MLHDDDDFDPTALTDFVTFDDARALSFAIERGNRDDARVLLERMFGESPLLSEAIQQGRFAKAA